MERRDRSLKALSELQYIDSLDDDLKAKSLSRWFDKYLGNKNISQCIDLDLDNLNILYELFYKNIQFLKLHRQSLQKDMQQTKQLKTFFN